MSGTTGERVARSRAQTHLPPPRKPRGPLLAVLALVVLAALGLIVFRLLRDPGQQAAPPSVDPAVEPERPPVIPEPARGEWRALPPAPLAPRTEQAAAWSGTELLVWGGSLEDGFGQRTFLADGAALDPFGAWRPLPEAPLDPRAGQVAVWTGEALVVWGGMGRTGLFADGAALDPASGAWDTLPQAPLSPRSGAVGVWTGREVLVVGGSDLGGPLTDGAAYESEDGRWRALPPLPEGFGGALELRGVADGDGALVWTADPGGLASTQVARYAAGSDRWEPVAVPVGEDAGLPVLASGGGTLYGLRVSLDGTEADVLTLAPGATTWTETPAPTSFGDPWRATGVWTGSLFVIASGDPSAPSVVYDLQAQTWTEIAPAPVTGHGERSVIWSGTELVVWGGPQSQEADASGAAWLLPAAA